MKINRSLTEFVVGFIVLAAIVVFGGCAPTPQADKASSPSVGMGDVQLLESQQTINRARAADLSRWVAMGEYYSNAAGMGDVHLVESQQSIPVTGDGHSMLPDTRMGDWKRFEAQQAIPDTGDQNSGHTYFGTGDPLKYRVPYKPQISGQTNPGLRDIDHIPGGR